MHTTGNHLGGKAMIVTSTLQAYKDNTKRERKRGRREL